MEHPFAGIVAEQFPNNGAYEQSSVSIGQELYEKNTQRERLAKSLGRQLRRAIGDSELTADSIERKAPGVLELLGISDGWIGCIIVRAALDIMEAKKIKNAAEVRNALGGDGYAGDLKMRREAIAAKSGLTAAGIYQRENVGLELLATELIELVRVRDRPPLDPGVIEAINGLRRAVEEQTALLRSTHSS